MWQLRGKYPNRGYPKIFQDETVGEEAKKLHQDALKLIDEVVNKRSLTAKGVVGIWPANSVGDDIEVYSKDGSGALESSYRTDAFGGVESNAAFPSTAKSSVVSIVWSCSRPSALCTP